MTETRSLSDPVNGKPLYSQIADAISDLIASKGLRPGDRLPSQNELMRSYGVSQATVRQALLNLTNRGLVVAEQGRGVFVAKPKLTADLSRPIVHARDADAAHTLDFEFLGAEFLFAPDRVADLLGIEPESQITRCRRKMRNGLRLVGLETANFPMDVVQQLSREDLHRRDYFEALSRNPKTAVTTIELSLGASAVTDFDAEILGVGPETIILQRIEVCRNGMARAVLMSRTTLLADAVELSGKVQVDAQR